MTDHVLTEKEVQISCKTCNADLLGSFCAQCGQKNLATRFTLRSVITDAIVQFLSLDRGLVHTVVSLIRKPGEVVQQYVSGKTILFSNPFRYFLLWITVAQLIALWSGAMEDFAEGFANGGGDEIDANRFISFWTTYYVLGLAGSFPFLVLGTYVFFLRSERNIAEHAIFHLFLSGQFALYVALALIVLGTLGDKVGFVATVIVLVAGITGVMRASSQFFNVGKFKAIVFTPLALGMAWIVYGGAILLTLKFIFSMF